MGNAISFRLNPKCESDRKILAWLEEKSSQPGYLNQTELIKQALLSAMESEQRGIREKEITEWMEQAIHSVAEEFTRVVQLMCRSQQFPIMSLSQILPKLWIVPQKICLEACLIWMMSKKRNYHSMTDCLTKRCLV